MNIAYLVRRILGGHKQHAIQCQGIGSLSRNRNVSVVNRIEGAAKNGDARGQR
jgi:hypothetical protein